MKPSRVYKLFKILKVIWYFLVEWWPAILLIAALILITQLDKILK